MRLEFDDLLEFDRYDIDELCETDYRGVDTEGEETTERILLSTFFRLHPFNFLVSPPVEEVVPF